MTCTKQQIRKFMRYRKTHTLEAAAAKAGMSENTARKYSKLGGKTVPKQEREYRTRRDPFSDVWEELEEMLRGDDGKWSVCQTASLGYNHAFWNNKTVNYAFE